MKKLERIIAMEVWNKYLATPKNEHKEMQFSFENLVASIKGIIDLNTTNLQDEKDLTLGLEISNMSDAEFEKQIDILTKLFKRVKTPKQCRHVFNTDGKLGFRCIKCGIHPSDSFAR